MKFLTGWLIGLLFLGTFSEAGADWFSEVKVGVFIHFLPGSAERFAQVETYDVETLAEQLKTLGVTHFVFTIYQNSGYLNAPNATYDRVTGYAPGERCAKRDLPMDLANALEKRGIRLILYVTGQTPNRDILAQKAFGLEQGPKDQKIDLTFAKRWGEVLQEWSVRYGTKVSGWWVDGCYAWIDFNEEIAEIYRDALKKGNPEALVAFNPGVKRAEWKTSDYTAGEINEPMEVVLEPSAGTSPRTQILTFMGNFWGKPETRYPAEEWSRWISSILKQGGVVTLDVAMNWDSQVAPVGTIAPQHFRQLQKIMKSVSRTDVLSE
ncbi:MAG: alpha-L-fucosidase [Planctomycetia bacterium]|nr:alpha-L-fucosidase [Planctomycetia bacterium]